MKLKKSEIKTDSDNTEKFLTNVQKACSVIGAVTTIIIFFKGGM